MSNTLSRKWKHQRRPYLGPTCTREYADFLVDSNIRLYQNFTLPVSRTPPVREQVGLNQGMGRATLRRNANRGTGLDSVSVTHCDEDGDVEVGGFFHSLRWAKLYAGSD